MSREIKVKKIKELTEELNKASFEYYVLDNPSLADKEYDKKYDELIELERETGHIEPNSPTQRVGDVVVDSFKSVTHRTHLWSLDKAQTKEELKAFIDSCIKFVRAYNRSHLNKLPEPQFIVTKKFDGITINSTYNENGDLIETATRGTGEIGESILEQSKTILNLPKKVNVNSSIDVHGEAMMTKQAFVEYNNSLKNGEKPLKNLRNGASGALRNLNTKEVARRKIVTQAYDLSYSEQEFETFVDTLEFMKEKEFTVAEYDVCNNFDEVVKAIDVIESVRSDLQFEIDGVVIALNDMRTRELMGYTIKFPKYAIAFKFEAVEATTTLLDVQWRTGRSGKITPRAVLKPVDLLGTTVSYATLNNIDDIRRKGVKIGAKVFIRRSNDVIPEIMGIAEDTEGSIEINVPENCPDCGSPLVQDGVHYFCENTLACKPQLAKSIVHFAEKKAMNIEGLSIKTIEQLMDAGIVNSVIDLYRLKDRKVEVIKLERFGVKKFNNLIESIEASKTNTLNRLVYGLGIEGIGEKASKDITSKFDTIEKLENASIADLLKINDIGEITASNLSHWFHEEKNQELLRELLQYITFEEEKKIEVSEGVKDNPFFNKKVYATGKFTLKKDELKSKLEGLGAIIASSYAKSLDMLIAGGDTSKSGKVTKAEQDGVLVVSEEYLMNYIK